MSRTRRSLAAGAGSLILLLGALGPSPGGAVLAQEASEAAVAGAVAFRESFDLPAGRALVEDRR